MSDEARNHPVMEHPRIDDERILDRYLTGRLSEEDEACALASLAAAGLG